MHPRDEIRLRWAVPPLALPTIVPVTAKRDIDQLLAENDALRSALERTRENFVAAVRGHPVRDMAETLAEVDAALQWGPTP